MCFHILLKTHAKIFDSFDKIASKHDYKIYMKTGPIMQALKLQSNQIYFKTLNFQITEKTATP